MIPTCDTPQHLSIIVDSAEPGFIRDYLRKMRGCHTEVADLAYGDYIVGAGIAVERKRVDDMVSSIADGRYVEQAYMLNATYSRFYWLMEGYPSGNFPEDDYYGAICSVTSRYGASVLWTFGPEQSAKAIASLARQYQKEEVSLASLRPDKPRDPDSLSRFIVSGLPGIGPGRAEELLRKFGSVEAIFSADIKDLQGTPGIGKTLATLIYGSIRHSMGKRTLVLPD